SSGDDLSVAGATLSSTPADYELQRGNDRLENLVTAGLQISEWIYGISVDPDLEVEMGAEAVARAADVADHLALGNLRSCRDRIGGLMRVAGRKATAVVDAGVVPVPPGPPGQDDGAGSRRMNRGPVRHADVDPGM